MFKRSSQSKCDLNSILWIKIWLYLTTSCIWMPDQKAWAVNHAWRETQSGFFACRPSEHMDQRLAKDLAEARGRIYTLPPALQLPLAPPSPSVSLISVLWSAWECCLLFKQATNQYSGLTRRRFGESMITSGPWIQDLQKPSPTLSAAIHPHIRSESNRTHK